MKVAVAMMRAPVVTLEQSGLYVLSCTYFAWCRCRQGNPAELHLKQAGDAERDHVGMESPAVWKAGSCGGGVLLPPGWLYT